MAEKTSLGSCYACKKSFNITDSFLRHHALPLPSCPSLPANGGYYRQGAMNKMQMLLPPVVQPFQGKQLGGWKQWPSDFAFEAFCPIFSPKGFPTKLSSNQVNLPTRLLIAGSRADETAGAGTKYRGPMVWRGPPPEDSEFHFRLPGLVALRGGGGCASNSPSSSFSLSRSSPSGQRSARACLNWMEPEVGSKQAWLHPL